MKFSIQRDRLQDGLNTVMKAISTKTTIPILSGLKIELRRDGLRLTGSDNDLTIQAYLPEEEDGLRIVSPAEEGAIVVQARMFGEIVRKLPGDIVEIESDEMLKVRIRAGKSDFQLIGSDASDYPLLPEIDDDRQFQIQADLLSSIIKQTGFAVSTSESRPVLTGVHWQVKGGELQCVATDSHRLARRITALDELPPDEYSAVIPGRSLLELSRILSDSQEPVNISMTRLQALFQFGNVLLYSRLLEGNYPDTSRLIPSDFKTEISIDGKALLQAIDRASLLAREDRNNVVRLVSHEGGAVEVSSHSPEVGKVEEEVQTASFAGDPLSISFSAKYMMEALKAIDAEMVSIHFAGAMRPFILRSAGEEAILQLILPVRT